MAASLAGPAVLNVSDFQAPSVPTFVDDISVPLDAAYPTGGYGGLEALLQAQTKDKRAIVEVLTPVALSGHFVAWDAANKKLKLFTCGGAAAVAAEVANNTDLSAVTLRLRVLSQ